MNSYKLSIMLFNTHKWLQTQNYTLYTGADPGFSNAGGGGGQKIMSFTALRLTARIQGPLTGPGSSGVAYSCDTIKPRRSKVKIPKISMNVYFSQKSR